MFNKRLALHSVPAVEIPEIGFVGGVTVFITANVIGKAPIGGKPLSNLQINLRSLSEWKNIGIRSRSFHNCGSEENRQPGGI